MLKINPYPKNIRASEHAFMRVLRDQSISILLFKGLLLFESDFFFVPKYPYSLCLSRGKLGKNAYLTSTQNPIYKIGLHSQYTYVGFQTQIASFSVLQFSQFCVFKLLSPTSLLQISLQITTKADRFEVSSFLDQISAVSLSLISPFSFYITHFNFSLLMCRENRIVFNSKSDFFFFFFLFFQFGPHRTGSISLELGKSSNKFYFPQGHIQQVHF